MSPGQRVFAYLAGAPRGVVVAIALGLVGVLGLADLATGEELSSSVFYALPVGLVAWFCGSRWATPVGLVAAGTWYAADLLAGAVYSAPWIGVWNSAVRLAYFLIIARLLVLLRGALDAQRRLAEVDTLTGLVNGRAFLDAVRSEVTRSARYQRAVSLAYIDLDGFKAVNDRWGHDVGDDLLEAVGAALRANVRATDVPARLGGDEFAVLFPETDDDSVREVARKLRVSLDIAMESHDWPVGFSMGVVTSNGVISDADELIRIGDQLMYEVKRTGKGRTVHRQARLPVP